jgi:hypothetical protein
MDEQGKYHIPVKMVSEEKKRHRDVIDVDEGTTPPLPHFIPPEKII